MSAEETPSTCKCRCNCTSRLRKYDTSDECLPCRVGYHNVPPAERAEEDKHA